MKELTKKDMIQYKISGLHVMERNIRNSDILNDTEFGEQVKRHLEDFKAISSEMNISMLKYELKAKFKELVRITRTVDYIIENREKLKGIANWIKD